jgi:hypothetical protein
MSLAQRWRARGDTLEAMVLLIVARLLIARVPFARWRGSLGRPVNAECGDPALRLETNLAARRLARAVDRAAARLPGESRCLARAMVLQWLLRQRGMAAAVVIGVRPGDARGEALRDLHAWVVRGGEVLIGATPEIHHPLYAASAGPRAG